MLTAREIRVLLDALRTKRVTLVIENGKISTDIDRMSGYSDDPEIGALQAKLSIMLEAAGRRGA